MKKPAFVCGHLEKGALWLGPLTTISLDCATTPRSDVSNHVYTVLLICTDAGISMGSLRIGRSVEEKMADRTPNDNISTSANRRQGQ